MDNEKIIIALTELQVRFDHISMMLTNINNTMEKHIQGEELRLQQIEDKLNVAKTVLFTLKALGLTFVAIMTLKFGDIITTIWKSK